MFGKNSMKESLKKVDIATKNITCDWVCKHCNTKNENRRMSKGCWNCKKI